MTVHADDRVLDLALSSPYLPYRSGTLTEHRGHPGGGTTRVVHAVPARDVFAEQLLAFHGAATGAAAPVNTCEDARTDLVALTEAFQRCTAG